MYAKAEKMIPGGFWYEEWWSTMVCVSKATVRPSNDVFYELSFW